MKKRSRTRARAPFQFGFFNLETGEPWTEEEREKKLRELRQPPPEPPRKKPAPRSKPQYWRD